VTDEEIEEAARVLRDGGLVAFPTETVYGLGADASNASAVRKVFAAKGRPPDHPVIVHLADASQLKHWAAEVPKSAWTLAEKFWPGPLTLVLRRASHVSDLVTGGQAVRSAPAPGGEAPAQAFGGGINASPKFGRCPDDAEHVRGTRDTVDLVLDGTCAVGIESIDLTRDARSCGRATSARRRSPRRCP
jgi:L-threonylcarbamoyladenylate synthase